MAGDHRITANHNLDVLHSAGFYKQGNTSIFTNNNCKLLSPAVSCGQGGHYWFDLRKVNIDRVQGGNSYILIRIVPDMFVFVALEDFSDLLSESTKRYRKNSGEVWGFYLSLSMDKKQAEIRSNSDSSLTLNKQLFEISEISSELEKLC